MYNKMCVDFFVFLFIITTAAGNNSVGYVSDPKNPDNSYKLVYEAKSWETAKDLCENDEAMLAVPKTESEFAFIQKLVRGIHYAKIVGAASKLVVWLGINNIENYEVWVTVDGEEISESGFNKWVKNNGVSFSEDPKEPHCAVADGFSSGMRHWWCNLPEPYICQKYKNNPID